MFQKFIVLYFHLIVFILQEETAKIIYFAQSTSFFMTEI